MSLWVCSKDGAALLASDVREAYYKLGVLVGAYAQKHNAMSLTLTDMPEEFDDSTYCIAYPIGQDPIATAKFWIRSRMD